MNTAIQTVLKDPSVFNSTVFVVAAVVGQILHGIKKWTEGYHWVLSNPRATVAAVITNIMGMVGFISTGALDEISKIGTLIALGIFMGLSADSAINKGSQVAWTDEQRAAKKG